MNEIVEAATPLKAPAPSATTRAGVSLLRAVAWLVATGLLATLLAGHLVPPLGGRPSLAETRFWAFVLLVPRVSTPLERQPDQGVARIRLAPDNSFRAADVSVFGGGALAYIDGVGVAFLTDEPLKVSETKGLVFSRNPRGQSLFVSCRSDCKQLDLVARRGRLIWALRAAHTPARSAGIGILALLLWITLVWRLRHSSQAAVSSALVAFSLLHSPPLSWERGFIWTDGPGLVAVAGLIRGWLRREPSGLVLDLSLTFLMVGLGATFTTRELRSERDLVFYQGEFGPAINVALGRGYRTFSPAELKRNPTLVDFLAGRADTPGRLELDDGGNTAALNQFQRIHRYLMWSVGATWRFLGISHSSLYIPWCLTVGLTVAAVFVLARSYLGSAAAAATSLIFLLAPSTIQMISSPRDFLKAPYLYLYLACLGRGAASAGNDWRSAWWALGAGLALGVGLGFRMDLFVLLPLFAIVLLMRFRARLQVVRPAIVFGVAFTLTGGPILLALAGGSNSSHVVLLGQSPFFDSQNGIFRSVNQWNAMEGYLDDRGVAVAEVAASVRGLPAPAYSTAGYDRLIGSVLREQLLWAPADILARVLRAHQIIWEMPAAPGNRSTLTPWWIEYLQSLWHRLAGWLWLLAVATFALERSRSYSVIFAALLFAVATSWLQLGFRHVFHWLPVSLIIQAMAVRACASSLTPRRSPAAAFPFSAGLVILCVLTLPAAVFSLTRHYQTVHRRSLARELLSASKDEVTAAATSPVLQFPTAISPRSAGMSAYAVLEVAWDQCPASSVAVEWGPKEGLRDRYRLYRGPSDRGPLSHLFHLRAFMDFVGSAPTFFFVPPERAPCVRVHHVDPRPDFPILWSVLLAPGWEEADHNLRLSEEIDETGGVYVPQFLSKDPSSTQLTIGAPGMGHPTGSWFTAAIRGDTVDAYRFEFREEVFGTTGLRAERSGFYRFEFALEAPGDEWSAGVSDPSRAEGAYQRTLGAGSLADPIQLLLRPFRRRHLVRLYRWLEAGESCSLLLRPSSRSGTVVVSPFTVARAVLPSGSSPQAFRSEQ